MPILDSAGDYFVTIKPIVDDKRFKDAFKKIGEIGAKESGGKGGKGGEGEQSRLAKSAGYLAALVGLLKAAIETGEKIVETGTEVSNKFVSSNSIFADPQIKSMMASMGVNTVTAQGMNFALEGLGLTMSDLSTATSAQREAFSQLTSQYNELMSEIDPGKMDSYNKAMQEYQLRELEFQMKLQVITQKMLIESNAVPELLESFTDMMDGLGKILTSDVVQWGFENFISFVSTLVDIVSAPINFLGGLFGGGGNSSNTTNNVNVTQNNSYNNAMSNNNSQLALEIMQALNG